MAQRASSSAREILDAQNALRTQCYALIVPRALTPILFAAFYLDSQGIGRRADRRDSHLTLARVDSAGAPI